MTADAMVGELMAYFAQGKYPDAVVSRMRALAESVGEDERKAVAEHMIENQKASFKVGVSDIVDSCRALGVGFRRAAFVFSQEWTCDACGMRFRRTQCSNDDARIDRSIHDYCPDCGLCPSDTIQAGGYNAAGIATPWYPERVAKARAALAARGPRWSRVPAERERREEKRVNVQRMVDALGKAKEVVE